jgi:hypothetical protein
MITFNSIKINELLQLSEVSSFVLVDIGGVILTTDYPYNLTTSDNKTFLSDGRLVSLDPPQLSSSVDTSSYKIILADSELSLGALFEQQKLIGKTASVRIGFVDLTLPVDQQIPLTNINDTILVYQGQIDSFGYEISSETIGSALMMVNFTSPMASLDLIKPYWGSKNFIQSLSPGDTSFDQVYQGSGKIKLKWGRK